MRRPSVFKLPAALPGAMVACWILSFPAAADTRVPARDGSGVLGHKDTPVLPWCGLTMLHNGVLVHHDELIHG